MKRKIIKIDENKCNGCGDCIPECKEGALQIIDGKCRLVSELFCDGLGACIGHCPEGAITIEEREAEPYDERKVMESLVNKPISVVQAHMKHLLEHGAYEYYLEAVEFLEERDIPNPVDQKESKKQNNGCPGSQQVSLDVTGNPDERKPVGDGSSELRQWPIQLHLVAPEAAFLKNMELLVMATCAPFVKNDIHSKYIKDRAVVVACPKLDYTDPYTDKLAEIFNAADTPKVLVVRLEVPCCGGLSKFARDAAAIAGKNDMEIEEHILGIDGTLKKSTTLMEAAR